MGSKGSQTSNTNQTQTYTPTGSNYITNALNQGQAASQLPFNIPAAPVAGFSPQQQQAFDIVGQSQGIANPYIQQAGQDFTPQGTSAFYNPMADAVTAQLKNVFGQQQQATTGNLTQAAGGVGADRIAVGQSELANQQGLAAGQTYANLYNQAAQQAQSAGYGQLAAGNTAQQSALTGANALLGTGGLQQQLSQAQLNSPYQLALAQAAFPYQQAQFNAGITGALAPALGGTTTGQGTTTSQYNPSIGSQILGGGLIGAGILGKGSGGAVPYAAGGPVGYDDGGGIPGGSPSISHSPIDISKGFIPSMQLGHAQSQMPQLNLSPQGGGSGSGSGGGQGGKGSQLGQDFKAGQGLMGMGNALFGNSANFGGGNLFSDDAWGGSASMPLEGLSASDYGLAQGGSVHGSNPFAPDFGSRFPQGYADGGGDLDQASDAIAGLESAGEGGYSALGPRTRTGDRAYGKYQIMGANIPEWTREATGQAMTPQEFLTSPQAQEATFRHQFGKYEQKYGPEGAARAWFAGERGMNHPNRRDQLGTSVASYAQRFNNAMGQQRGLPSAITGGDQGGMPGQALGFAAPEGKPENPMDFSKMAGALADQGTTAPNQPAQPKDPAFAGFESQAKGLADKDTFGPNAPKPKFDQQGNPFGPVPMPLPRPPEADSAPSPPVTSAPPEQTGPQKKEGPFSSIGNFLKSPNAALIAAGLSAWTPQGIAGGFQNAMKLQQGQQSVDQTAKKLELEAKHYEDQFTRMTPYQQGELANKKEELEYKKAQIEGTRISPDASRMIAEQLLVGNTAAAQGLGYGNVGAQNRAQVMRDLEVLARQKGMSGGDLAAAKASFMAESAAARSQAIRQSNVESSIHEAQLAFPQVVEASEAMPRGSFVPWNQMVQQVQRGTSSPQLARLVAAIQAARTAYSQAMSRTGVNTVHAQLAADELLNSATSHEALLATLGQMKREMDLAERAPAQTRANIMARISGRQPEQAQPGTGAASAPPAQTGPAGGGRTVVNEGVSKSTGKKFRKYSDGTVEEVP